MVDAAERGPAAHAGRPDKEQELDVLQGARAHGTGGTQPGRPGPDQGQH